jgi:AcrR family transcriptional regulator
MVHNLVAVGTLRSVGFRCEYTPDYLTAKGDARARLIVEATLRCLASDGYAGASIQRIADEAGVPKRSVLYYYGSRDELFACVVAAIVARLVDRIPAAVAGLDTALAIVDVAFDAVWEALTRDRGLVIAWFGLQTEAITNPALQPVVAAATERLRGLFAQLITEHQARGGALRIPSTTLQSLLLAALQGLALEWLARGTTPDLENAIAEFQAWVVDVAT